MISAPHISAESVHKANSRRLLLAPIITLLFFLAVESPAYPESTTYPFSMCSNGAALNNPTYPPKIVGAGAHMCRVDMSFPAVRTALNADKTPGAWDWQQAERLRELRRQYPQLDWLPVIGYGGSWSEDAHFKNVFGSNVSCPQRGIKIQPVTSSANLYGNFVFEMVNRYKDVFHFWESWNEPDLPDHAFFKGNGKDFFPYQKACYLAAKKADPNCKVLFAGLCFANIEGYLSSHGLKAPTPFPPNSSFFEEYLKECIADPDAKANNFYFDVLSQHTYSRASDLFDYVEIDKNMMRKYLQQDKPVWITEMGFPDGGGLFGGTPEEYCDYILQSYAWGKLAGVENFFHFQLDDSNGHGLYTMNSLPKPALTTYRDVLVKEFADAHLVAQLHGNRGVGLLNGNSPFHPTWSKGYDLFEFDTQSGRKRILMAFADTSNSVDIKIPAKAATATIIDRHAKRSVIKAVGNTYSVHLAGATNSAGWPSVDNIKTQAMGTPEHLVGGASIVIVEELSP